MFNLTINAIDQVANYKFESVQILTESYSRKISKNELHTPVAAKLTFKMQDKKKQFIFSKPIIVSNSKGDISIFSSYALKKSYEYVSPTKQELAALQRKYLIFQNSKLLGLQMMEKLKLYKLENDYFLAKIQYDDNVKKNTKNNS